MRGRAPAHGKEQDGLGTQGMLHGSATHKTMKKGGEIEVFDAGKYFAGAENQRLKLKEGMEMEDELDDEAKSADADGDLPLSPLPEFYISGKAGHHTKQNHRKQDDAAHHVYAGPHTQGKIAVATALQAGARVAPVRRQMASIGRNAMPKGGPLPSPPALAAAISDSANPLTKLSAPASDFKLQGKHSSSMSKPSSPSMRLASFLAKFKLSSETKSKSQSTAQSVSSGQQATTPPKSSFFSNASTLSSNGKTPSPRGRFLRALSSSSSQSNPFLKPISQMHHHGSVAASTPVSPAGSTDPYSPITHSASTTPTSRKNPRSHARSHVPTSPGSLDWRRDVDNASSRSLSAHLPFIRRKLRAYLMPEKAARHRHQEDNDQQVIRNKQETHGMAVNHDHQLINSNRTGANKQSVRNRMAPNNAHHPVMNNSNDHIGDKQRQAGSIAGSDKKLVSEHSMSTGAQGQHHDRQQRANSMRSPAHRATGTDTRRLASMKDTRRRGEWARRPMAGEELVEDDIEVAERLLRVVREHQSALSTHQSPYAANHINMKGGMSRRQNGVQQGTGFVDQGSGLAAENGSASRKSRKSSSISPFSSPARYSTKEEYGCPYDSDSSSDLFEIETLQAFSHVAGLYRPRDLPVYDNKSPLHSSK